MDTVFAVDDLLYALRVINKNNVYICEMSMRFGISYIEVISMTPKSPLIFTPSLLRIEVVCFILKKCFQKTPTLSTPFWMNGHVNSGVRVVRVAEFQK